MVLPAATPITTPLVALIDATPGLLLLQVPPTLPLLVRVVDNPAQTVVVPLMVPASGSGFTVTRCVALDVPQIAAEPTVYIIVAFPAATPVTTPVVALTVATPGVVLVHVPPLFPLALKLMVDPAHTADAPLIVPASGSEFTVTTMEATDEPQLLVTL